MATGRDAKPQTPTVFREVKLWRPHLASRIRKQAIIKTFLDMVGKQTPEGNTPPDVRRDLVMRTMASSESLTEKLASAQAGDAAEEKRGITDPLIQGLVARLPKPDGVWPLEDRAKWLRTAAGVFDLIYKARDGDRREISIVIAKQDTANPPMADSGTAEVEDSAEAEFNIGASSPLGR